MPSTHQELRSARVIAVLTLLSRLTGLLRELVFSRLLGTSGELSAFRVAYLVPNLARRLFGEGALSAATIPVLTESLEKEGEHEARRFVGSVLAILFSGLTIAAIVVGLVLWVFQLVSDDPSLPLTIILIPYMPIICTVAVAGGVLNVRGHFATPAAVPVLLNVCVISATLWGGYGLGLTSTALLKFVCYGVLLGGLCQLVVTFAALRLVRFFPRLQRPLFMPQVRSVFTLMSPMVLGLSAVQINAAMDYLIAYFFITVDGEQVGPAVLGYAQYLYQLPLGVFGIAIATAVFPALSMLASQQKWDQVVQLVQRGLRMGFIIAVPSTVGLWLVSIPLVATLYQGQQFDEQATLRVAGTLRFYALGLVPYFAQHILVRAFYAAHDSKTPARIAGTMVAINFTLNLILVFTMEERGLALSTAVCAAIQAIWLGILLSSRYESLSWLSLAASFMRVLIASAMMAASVLVVGYLLPVEAPGERPVIRLIVEVTAGVIAYGFASRWLGLNVWRLVVGRQFDAK